MKDIGSNATFRALQNDKEFLPYKKFYLYRRVWDAGYSLETTPTVDLNDYVIKVSNPSFRLDAIHLNEHKASNVTLTVRDADVWESGGSIWGGAIAHKSPRHVAFQMSCPSNVRSSAVVESKYGNVAR